MRRANDKSGKSGAGFLESLRVSIRGASSGREAAKKGFRPDVEGLRAVAVVAVLLYHGGMPFARGGYVGVDVFFVISGFLITGLLLGEMEKTGTLSLGRFYSRRAKRLLPLTVVVLGAVAVMSWLFFDPVRMDETSSGIVAAGLYVMNWFLAAQATDYFAAGLQASPVQHFWTLAVEEQFYLVWPALLLFVAWWCRRTGRSLRPAVAVVLAVVTALSLAYSVHSTGQDAGAAYFSTLTRAWELALGGALALAPASRLRLLPRPAAFALALAGLAAISFSILRFDDDTLFPGYAALVPTLGTAAIIAAGFAATPSAPSRLLTLSPVRHVGRISYSWYLWHWPPLVFAAALWGELSPIEGLAVLAASYVPAVLTNRLVEKPFLHSETLTRFPRKALALGGACTILSVALGLLLFAVTPTTSKAPESEVAGAEAARGRETPQQKDVDALNPTPREAPDFPLTYQDGCHVDREGTESPACVYGDPAADTTVALFGDSHAMHWFPALNALAKERGWRLVSFTKDGCPAADFTPYSEPLRREYTECDEWRKKTLDRLANEERPDMVVTSGRTTDAAMENGERLGAKASEEEIEEGYVSTLEKLRGAGSEVVVIEDIPLMDTDVPVCVSRSLDSLDECATPRDEAFDYPAINESAAEKVEGARFIDPTPILCGEKTCPAVIGDVIVYGDDDHLTSTYARTLAPWLGERLPDPAGS